MVCPRCVEAVKQEFEKLDIDIEIVDIELGRVTTAKGLVDCLLYTSDAADE